MAGRYKQLATYALPAAAKPTSTAVIARGGISRPDAAWPSAGQKNTAY